MYLLISETQGRQGPLGGHGDSLCWGIRQTQAELRGLPEMQLAKLTKSRLPGGCGGSGRT